MIMNPRERVLAALAHRPPDRVPFAWGFGTTHEMGVVMQEHLREQGVDWWRLRDAVTSIVKVSAPIAGPDGLAPNAWHRLWGIGSRVARYDGGAYREFADFPLAGVTSPSAIDAHPWPRAEQLDPTALHNRIALDNPGGTRAVMLSPGGNPFEIYCWLTGLEEALTNLLTRPEVVRAALEHITGFFVDLVRGVMAEVGERIDLVFFADDLGSQTGPLLSPRAYRDVLQPFHARLTAAVRETAPHARSVFHTDGSVFDLIPDLLDAGVDVLEAVQTDAAGMDPARLKAACGDRLSFHGGISVQHLLPHASAAEVAAECRRLVEVFGAGGGYIAAPSHAIQVGTPPANVMAMLQAILGPERLAAGMAVGRRGEGA